MRTPERSRRTVLVLFYSFYSCDKVNISGTEIMQSTAQAQVKAVQLLALQTSGALRVVAKHASKRYAISRNCNAITVL